ncbi:MAG TPA: DUF3343 domain-containing protein [Anaerolineaceae bacterium]
MTGYHYILVYSTSHALQLEKLLNAAGVATRLVPVPRHLSSDCGVCLRISPEGLETSRQVIAGSRIEIQGIM